MLSLVNFRISSKSWLCRWHFAKLTECENFIVYVPCDSDNGKAMTAWAKHYSTLGDVVSPKRFSLDDTNCLEFTLDNTVKITRSIQSMDYRLKKLRCATAMAFLVGAPLAVYGATKGWLKR